jgi:N-succinyl-L-ornithine transcarbamylase
MKNFTGINDVSDFNGLMQDAIHLHKNNALFSAIAQGKTLGMVFMNPSLRTRLSTQKAAQELGFDTIVMNANEGWSWEINDSAVMNGNTVEHIKDVAATISTYCDIIAIRCFPGLTDKEYDYNETLLNQFIKYATVPVISLESATLHPLQSFADALTISNEWKKPNPPKVVLCWAPHIKPLPQAVANSFCEWMPKLNVDFHIAHPKRYALEERFTQHATVHNDQSILENADFIYFKNWSSVDPYGEMPLVEENWLIDESLFLKNPEVKIMHCLPVRRNVEVKDQLLDHKNSLIQQQIYFRKIAAKTVLKKIIESL